MNRKEQAELTKKKLFITAVNLIKQKGFEDITVSEICKKAGVAKGTFYVHYQAKEDIIKESYYADMNDYIMEHYNSYVMKYPESSLKERIEHFLLLELYFTDYVGLELTSLAFGINLNQCSKGISTHFQRRKFTGILKDLLHEGKEQQIFTLQMDEQQIFLYLETMIRGLMASWCFANNTFDIKEVGKIFIKTQLESILS